MKIVVTGGCGFIGSHLCKEILRSWEGDNTDNHLFNLDDITYSGNLDNVKEIEDNPNYTLLVGDIADKDIWKLLPRGIDVIINCANNVVIHTNIMGTYRGLEYARIHGSKFVQVGSNEEYGETLEKVGSKETDICNPKTPYAATRLAATQLALSYHYTNNVPVIVTRGCNTYGPNQYSTKLIPFFIKNILSNKPCTIYGDGDNMRQWIHVEDHVKGILFAMNTSESGEIYNIGTNVDKSVIEIFEILQGIFPQAQRVGVNDKPGHVKHHKVNWDKIMEKGWKPMIEFDDGFKKTIQWYQDNKKFLGEDAK